MKNFIQRLAEKRAFPFDKKKDDGDKKKPQDAKSDDDNEEDDDSASDDKENDKPSTDDDDDNVKKNDNGDKKKFPFAKKSDDDNDEEEKDDDETDEDDGGDKKDSDKDFEFVGDDDKEKEDGEDKDDGEPLPPNPSSKTLLNNPKDQIKNESVVFTFARMNPPNRGHEHLVNKIKTIAEAKHSDAKVFLSHSHDPRKNPLPYEEKMTYARKAFGDIVTETTHTDLSSLLEELHTQYKSVTLVVRRNMATRTQYGPVEWNPKLLLKIASKKDDNNHRAVDQAMIDSWNKNATVINSAFSKILKDLREKR